MKSGFQKDGDGDIKEKDLRGRLAHILENLFMLLDKKIQMKKDNLEGKSHAIQRKNGKKLTRNNNKMIQLEKRFGKKRVFYFKQNTIRKISQCISVLKNMQFISRMIWLLN